MKLALYVDAMSVFAAVTATFLKIPAEKSLLSHVQYIWELLDTHVLEARLWIDTRDVIADGLTRGSVDREAIDSVLRGSWDIAHTCKCWISIKQRVPRHMLP